VTPRDRFAAARVARLATAGPHVVPICFALEGETIWSAVDGKPKRTRALRRLENIAHDPRVSLLVDHYEEDWSRLWWARADGTAAVHDDGPVDLLCARYEQYAQAPPAGPFIAIAVERWSGWSASS
jgi:PPOX class probable F420-dependent enzyme